MVCTSGRSSIGKTGIAAKLATGLPIARPGPPALLPHHPKPAGRPRPPLQLRAVREELTPRRQQVRDPYPGLKAGARPLLSDWSKARTKRVVRKNGPGKKSKPRN